MAIWQHLFLFNLVGQHEKSGVTEATSVRGLMALQKGWCCLWIAMKACGKMAAPLHLSFKSKIRHDSQWCTRPG